MRLSLIVAMATNRVIGRDGDLPWHLSADLRRFKKITMGHHLIMGRKTYESIGRPLPGRTSIVITRQPNYEADEVLVAHDFPAAIEMATSDDEIFVVGGAEIYRIAIHSVDRIYFTSVHADVRGDVLFPEYDLSDWQLVESVQHVADDKNSFDYSFLIYDRKHKTRTIGTDAPTT